MTGYHGTTLQLSLVANVKAAWGLADSAIYSEPPRSPLGLPYAVVQFDSFQQENAYADAVNPLMVQNYQFSVLGFFERTGSGNAASQQSKIEAIVGGLSPEPVGGVSFERYVSNADIQQTEFESEPAWLVNITVVYTVYEEI